MALSESEGGEVRILQLTQRSFVASTLSSLRLLLDDATTTIGVDMTCVLPDRLRTSFVEDRAKGQMIAATISNRQVLSVLGALRADGWAVLASDVQNSGEKSKEVLTRTMYLEKRIAASPVSPVVRSPSSTAQPDEADPEPVEEHPVVVEEHPVVVEEHRVEAPPEHRREHHAGHHHHHGDSASRDAAHFKKLADEKSKAEELEQKKLDAMTPEERAKHLEAEAARVAHDKLKSKHAKNLASTFGASRSNLLLRGRGRGRGRGAGV